MEPAILYQVVYIHPLRIPELKRGEYWEIFPILAER